MGFEIAGLFSVVFLASALALWWRHQGYSPWLLVLGGGIAIVFSGYGILLLGIWAPVMPSVLIWAGVTVCLPLRYPSLQKS